VKKFLNSIELPGIGLKLGEVGRVLSVNKDGEQLSAQIELGFPFESARDEYVACLTDALLRETGAKEVAVELSVKVVAHSVQPNVKAVPNVRNIIAVASGKGGVGKSTVAVNLALALAAEGARVGILDADIYGPSQPQMLGLDGKVPDSEDGKTMIPLRAHGVQVMSIGFLVENDQPMVWRGPMVTSALQQLLNQTNWDDLDYLVVDMPPGTGDIQLTLSQSVPVSGAVIVTTPQNIATLDARKGLAMFNKVSINVLGVVENMSTHVCSNCGHEEPIFGSGGADKMSKDFNVPLLGRLPLDAKIREQTDSGTPTVVADPGSHAAADYRNAALRMAALLASRDRDYTSKFGKIVVEENK
jgi:ATP-binding protein involved in chromosome partitioning